MSKALILLLPLGLAYFLSHAPIGTSPVWVCGVQLGLVTLLVIIPYLTSRRVNYRRGFPVVTIMLFTLGLLTWSGVICWSAPFVPNLRPLAILGPQGLVSLMTCWAYTQSSAEQRSIA